METCASKRLKTETSFNHSHQQDMIRVCLQALCFYYTTTIYLHSQA